MAQAGIATDEELARRCGLAVEVVCAWHATEGGTMLLREAVAVKKLLRVRPSWFLDEEEQMLSLTAHPQAAKLLDVARELSPNALRITLRYAERLKGR